ncbi:hypothetical protein HK104_007414 [Borealophlyctis nickersoniae]|nr:hypothetical protein HK104_007414 [Borealophlyctis nickersoniae]
MFWRFGFTSATAIDGLLEKEGLTLDELLDEEELLQECKAHNARLIEFLCKPEVLTQLLGYIIADDLDENKRFKYPYLASEVLSCEIFAICEAVIANTELLNNFWTFLDRPPPLNPLQANYFCKVNGVLLQKKTPEMVAFVRGQPNVVGKLLTHIGTSATADLLLKLISMEEVPEASGVVQWLAGEGLIPSLVGRLDPNQDTEIHNTASQTLLDIIAVSYQNLNPTEQVLPGLGGMGDQMNFPSSVGGNTLVDELKSEAMMTKLVGYMLDKSAPNAGSTLTNGINIIIELIRRYCSEIEQAEFQQHQHQLQQQAGRQGPSPPSEEKLQSLSTDLNELLHVLGSRIVQFSELLTNPRNLNPIDTTLGKQTPLGSERLKTCELFAEILHLQYLYTSSPLFEKLVVTKSESKGTSGAAREEGKEAPAEKKALKGVADELVAVTDKFIDAKVLPVCLDLFFNFPWNNFLHSVVYDMIAKVFNTYSFSSTANMARSPGASPVEGGENAGDPATAVVEEQMKAVKTSVRKLVISIFKEGRLTSRITQAQRANDSEVANPKGVRLGFMGHLTYISDEVCKLLEKCSADLGDELRDFLYAEDWQEYVNGTLRETKERDRQPLGGARPNTNPQQHALPLVTGIGGGFNAANLDEADTGATSGAVGTTRKEGGKESDEDDDDIEGLGGGGGDVYVADGDVASDQFARYLCQQIVNDLPDRFLGGESSDEEEDEADWSGEFDSKDVEFDLREAFDPDNPFRDKTSSLGTDFEDDEDVKVPVKSESLVKSETQPAGTPSVKQEEQKKEGGASAAVAGDAKETSAAQKAAGGGGGQQQQQQQGGWADFSALNNAAGGAGDVKVKKEGE